MPVVRAKARRPLRGQTLGHLALAHLSQGGNGRQLAGPGPGLGLLPLVDRLPADAKQNAHLVGRKAQSLAQAGEAPNPKAQTA